MVDNLSLNFYHRLLLSERVETFIYCIPCLTKMLDVTELKVY